MRWRPPALPKDPDLEQLPGGQVREPQRAVRSGEPSAAVPVAPRTTGRRHVPLTAAQLVLAREHGFASWARLRRYIGIVTERAWTPGKLVPNDESLADRCFRLACPTHSDDEAVDAGPQ